MKSKIHKRLLSLAVVEILHQIGYERVTEQSLFLLTDLLAHYIESLCRAALPFQGSSSAAAIEYMVSTFYADEEYQQDELLRFAEQQSQLCALIKDQVASPSILHMTKVLPQEIAPRSTAPKTVSSLNMEEKGSPVIPVAEATVDDFLLGFIEHCQSEPSARTVGEYSYDVSQLLDRQEPSAERRVSDTIVSEILSEERHFSSQLSDTAIFTVLPKV